MAVVVVSRATTFTRYCEIVVDSSNDTVLFDTRIIEYTATIPDHANTHYYSEADDNMQNDPESA